MTLTPFRDTPIKRALLHMLRHGGLRRNRKGNWVGKTAGGLVWFRETTVIAAAECGLVKISINRKFKARHFASLTPKGMDIAKSIAAVLRAREKISKAIKAPEIVPA